MENKKYGIVTGASRGLGAAIAEELAREGYDLVITYHTQAEKAEAVKERLKKEYGVNIETYKLAIENEDAGEDDEPEHYWYYFQANGKALTNGDNSDVSLKTINGKKYSFDEEGKMLFGWVAEDNAERIDNTDGDAFK